MSVPSRLVIAITGASGVVYGVRLLDKARELFDEVYAVLSGPAALVLRQEMDIEVDPAAPSAEVLLGRAAPDVHFASNDDFLSPIASGSFAHEGMIVAPCSMGSAGRIANGTSDDLIARAADVTLKERRPLVLVVRETPLSLVHLRNLVRLAEAGAIIMPASPGFYLHPGSVEEMVEVVVNRALQAVGRQVPGVDHWRP
jgi:4-hydroxy-3-polyprenylbenzoate decarboxylase